MTTRTLQKDNSMMNGIVLVDFENICELLKKYGKDPMEIEFFKVIQTKLKEAKLNIIDFIVYSNFERKTFPQKQQTILRAMGLQTRHASNNGKNSGDLELTVDALRALYKNPNINVFVIISSDRDIIPLLKAIKYENKVSYLISTMNGFNRTVIEYADFHEYIEAIFGLTTGMLNETQGTEEILPVVEPFEIGEEEIKRAREVSQFFYNSHIWKRSIELKEAINLKGYINVVSRILNRFPNDILNDFKVAHQLKYVTLYQDQDQRLCLKQGEKKNECLKP